MPRRNYHRLKRDEIEVKAVRFTKAELDSVPREHLLFYLLLGQHSNEVTMLHSLLLRSLNDWTRRPQRTGPDPERETTAGLSFFFVRAMCARLWEARECINEKANSTLMDELWASLPKSEAGERVRTEAAAARKTFNRSSSLNEAVRNKLASHLDRELLAAGYDRIAPTSELTDFHTGRRGTTFFGVADTATALAADELRPKALSGMGELFDGVLLTSGAFKDFADAFVLGFYLVHFGEGRLSDSPKIRLRGLAEAEKARIGFYLAGDERRMRT